MPKSPEQFDFSKLKDQQKFDKLPDDKKQELIEKSHEEAFKVDKENSVDKRIAERFGDIKIEDDLKKQISSYLDNNTLTIANEFIAAVKTERSERGAGIGYWDQLRVFLHDQNAMKEWNWRHKDSQNLDRKDLEFNSIGDIQALKKGDKIIITLKLVNNDGSRNVSFEFTADKDNTTFEDGKIATKVAGPTEKYARKEIDEKLEHAWNMDEVQSIAKASGQELQEKDFRKVVGNLLKCGNIEYFKRAQKVAEEGGLELNKEDYKQFVLQCRFSTEWIDAKGKYWQYPENETCKAIRGIDVVAPLASFSTEDYEEMLEKILSRSKTNQDSYNDKKGLLEDAEKMVEYGQLDKKALYEVAKANLDLWSENSDKVLELIKSHNIKFTKEEYEKLTKGFLAQARDYFKNPVNALTKAKEVAEMGKIEIAEDDYKKFFDDAIKRMYESRYSYHDIPEELKRDCEKMKEVAEIAGLPFSEKDFYKKVFFEIIEPRYKDRELHPSDRKTFNDLARFFKPRLEEVSLPEWLKDVQGQDLEEAEKLWSFKPEMRNAKSHTGNKPYEKPEITESVVDEKLGYGAFVLREQIDHDTRFPQMRYTLYFIDKTGNKKEIFEKHDYVDDGGGGSIYAKNDPAITDVQITGKKIKFKVGRETHEVSI